VFGPKSECTCEERMQKNATAALLLCLTTLLASCAGMITASPGFGVGTDSGWRPPPERSTSLFLPLNFSLRTKEKVDLTRFVGQLTDDRIKDFVSVGVRALSYQFGLDATAWDIAVTQNKAPGSEPENRLAGLLNFPVKSIALDYKVTCDLKSPKTGKLQRQGASEGQVALIAIDRLENERFDYRAMFSGTVVARLRTGLGDTVFFDIDMQISIERKSRFADDKHFDAFESIDQNALQRLRLQVTEKILEAYVVTLNQYGLQVQREMK